MRSAAVSLTGGKNLSIKELRAGYDIIGDVHGCYEALVALLTKLGYVKEGDAYVYPNGTRQLIFLGDLIDRGPNIVKTLRLVKACVDVKSAQVVLGNHEFNLIAYNTETPDGYLRKRDERNTQQLKETFAQFETYNDELHDYITWFKALPLFLELDEFRVVHACWDQEYIDGYLHQFGTNQLTNEVIHACIKQDEWVLTAIRRLTRGINLACPDNVKVKGWDGLFRNTFRARFFGDASSKHYKDIVFQPDPLPPELAESLISDANLQKLIYYSSDEKPLFVGHYWLTGEPDLIAKNIACVDYSAVSGGEMAAYRYHLGDHALDKSQFVSVSA